MKTDTFIIAEFVHLKKIAITFKQMITKLY
jgi:hypothetical protein